MLTTSLITFLKSANFTKAKGFKSCVNSKFLKTFLNVNILQFVKMADFQSI